MMPTGKIVVTFSLILFISLIFAVRSSAAPGEIIITHASMSTSTIPLWIAQRRDFFRKYGVNAKSVWVRGNPAQIATLVSGDTQIAYGGAPTAMAAAVGGRDMKIIASLSSRENLDLVARPGINSAKDLRGKRFGVQSVGGGVWKTATVWLEHFGMDERRDNIQMIVIGDVTILSQSLESGLIDATVVPGYLSRRLADKGFVVLGRCEQTKLPSVGMTVLVERPYLQQNAETLQNVMKALSEAMVFICQPEEQTRCNRNDYETVQDDRYRGRRRSLPRRRDPRALGRVPQALCLDRSDADLATVAKNTKSENRRHQGGNFD